MEISLIQSLLIAFGVGIASGSIGSFVILRRMALVGDALSHVALPGIAVAIAYGIDPFWGVLVSLIAAAFIIFWLEKQTKLSSEALVGILFTASLAIGIMTIPDTEILESLFGNFPAMSPYLLALIIFVALLITIFAFVLAKRFSFRIISPELAEVNRIKKFHDLVFFLIFALTVALGIKLVGTLLMGALTIIPPSIAKNVTKSMRGYVVLSAIFGALISVSGVFIAYFFHLLPGPTIILLGVFLFLGSMFFIKK